MARFASGQYAGSKVCAGCHPSQAKEHAGGGHARSLARATEHALKAGWSVAVGEWAFGAGQQAVTFVSRVDDEFHIEHGLTWYSASGKFGITPGHRTAAGERYRTFAPDAAILRCFQCHSTGPLRLAQGFRIEPAEAGVQCEACHGPGAAHAVSRKTILNPRRITAGKMNELCGACHRKPAAAGGDTDWGNPWNARHQPLYLNRSACFQRSRGALSCRTCHRAHQPLARNAAEYGRICADCHARPHHKSAVSARACVHCHMPEVRPIPELRFANHWIGVYAPGAPLQPVSRR